jgi:diguanylate cyclase (GGDEF)-like protein
MQPERKTNVVTPVRLTAENVDDGQPCLVVIYGPLLARRFPLEFDEMTIGRSDDADVRIDDDSASRIHARFVVNGGDVRIFDLDSTNGTFVNDRQVTELELRDGDYIQVGETIFKFLSGSNVEAKYHQEMYSLTTIDGLTKAYNRRYFVEVLEREIMRARRYERPLVLGLIDIDHFKKINDTWGHLAGDQILKDMSRIVLDTIRKEDIFSRYGGEEFALLLPEVGLDGAKILCERLRTSIEGAMFRYQDKRVQVTVSLGLACTPCTGDRIVGEKLIELADAKLYEAKESGRNKLCC